MAVHPTSPQRLLQTLTPPVPRPVVIISNAREKLAVKPFMRHINCSTVTIGCLSLSLFRTLYSFSLFTSLRLPCELRFITLLRTCSGVLSCSNGS